MTTSRDAAARWGRASLYIAKVVVVFAAVGPLVGLLILALGIAVNAIVIGPIESIWLAPFFLLYGIVFAHFAGLTWAALAGLSCGAAAVWTRSAPLWLGPAAGTLTFAIATATGNAGLPPGPESPQGEAIDSLAPLFAVLMAAIHIGAATLCWLMARRFRLPPP